MVGAKINGAIVPIDRVPNNGDIIEIITSSSSKGPSRDWLKIVKTGEARSKIRQWFKREKRTENIEIGRQEVYKEVRRFARNLSDDKIDEIVLAVAKKAGIQTAEDFYNTLGFGGLSLQRFLTRLKEEVERQISVEEQPTTQEEELARIKLTDIPKKRRATGGVIIDGEPGCQVKFAKCCNPLPGDKIVGFVTRGFGVSVHKTDCPNVSQSRKNEDNLARWVRAEWDTEETSVSVNYEAMIQIIAEDGIGVIASISSALADMKVSISQIYTTVLKDGSVAINLHIGCKSTSHFDSIVSRLRSVKSVISVHRGFIN